jgi:hypothetical protein
MNPKEAQEWSRSKGLKILWTSSSTRHFVTISGPNLEPITREYTLGDEAGIDKILDEIVTECEQRIEDIGSES